MQDITALEQRITSALDRIGKRVDQIGTAPRPVAAPVAAPLAPPVAAPAVAPVAAIGPSAAEAALKAQLDEERALTAQLQTRLRASKEREAKGDMQEKLDRVTRQLDVQGLELQRMRRVNSTLREQIEALRTAQLAGVTEPQLINKAMAAELDALRALRLTEVAEMDEILAALEPHLTEAENART